MHWFESSLPNKISSFQVAGLVPLDFSVWMWQRYGSRATAEAFNVHN